MRLLLERTIDVFLNCVRTHLSLHTDTINYFSSWPRSVLVDSPWVVRWSSLPASELWTSPWSLRQSPTHQTWRGQDILHLPIFFVVQCLWIYQNLCWIPSVAKPLRCPFLARRDPSGWPTCRQLVTSLTSLPIPLVCKPMEPRWRVPSIFPNNSTNLSSQQSTQITSQTERAKARQVQPLLLNLVRNCLSKAVTARSGGASAQRGSLSCGRSTTCRGQTGNHFPNLHKLFSAKLFLSLSSSRTS